MIRKIIQICASATKYTKHLYALTDDGETWELTNGGFTWTRLPQIPQFDDAASAPDKRDE